MKTVNVKNYSGNYSEKSFWAKLMDQACTLGKDAVYNILLLYYLMLDGDVPFNIKMEIVGALGYLILPLDLIPDFIPVAGYSDDMAAIMFVLGNVDNYITPRIRSKARSKANEIFG